MYFLVSNIPEAYRTPDLRCYFSEYVEKGAFKCFHFRHRPLAQVKDLLADLHGLKAQNTSGSNDGSSLSDTGISDALRPSGTKCNAYDNQITETCEKEDTPQSPDSSSSPNTLRKPHWLSQGLSGLSSIISEKKAKAKIMTVSEKNNLGVADRKSHLGDDSTSGLTDLQKETALGNEKTNHYVEELISLISKDSEPNTKKSCCIIDVQDSYAQRFVSLYHRKHWVDRKGEVNGQRCYLFQVNKENSSTSIDDEKIYKTKAELDSQGLSLKADSMLDLIEFHPPSLMPQGNVGTPTHHFQALIRTCQLPGSIITKLGLTFPKTRGKKRFSQVPFDYKTKIVAANDVNLEDQGIVFTAGGHLIPSSVDFKKPSYQPLKKKTKTIRGPKLELEEEAEDGAEVEEWERYETFHNDVTSQDRIKERRFEKEEEVTWEKGGPGLVFYTDAQFWREREGDFDEQTADEWDVDMSVYYGEGGDSDAQASLEMLESDRLRLGSLSQSAFTVNQNSKKKIKKEQESVLMKKRKIGPRAAPPIGVFEAHTRGVGRRLLEAQGWQEGQGLGRDSSGMPFALDNDGQAPHDKKGFGYHGEKLQGWGATSSSSLEQQKRHRLQRQRQQSSDSPGIRISTVFDSKETEDPPTPVTRTQEPTVLSHRHNYVPFTKASETTNLS